MNLFRKVNHAMMRLLVRAMPSCRDVSVMISQGMDGDPPLRKRISVRLHVSMCGLCRRYEEQLHMLRQGAARYADPDKNETVEPLSAEARQRLEKALANGAE